jgi:hypothetical protein|tara:strand:+ start:5655 stop:6509 length:855 start_codon:yes stop_codon:yes gene_type:complete
MISVIGIGNAASAIAENFKTQSNYKVYQLGSNYKSAGHTRRLKAYETPEEYEENIPDLTKFFKDITEDIQVFIVGSSYSSNYSLGVLEQLKDKKLEVFYIKPDVELLTGIPKLVENMLFGVLQEYARSALFKSITILSNLEIENSITGLSIKNYYEKLNHTIFSCVHYLNFFNHTEPEIGQMAKPSEINRIRTIGILNSKTLSEKWLFELDMPRESCYYICINQERLEKESGLHKQVVDKLKEKPRNAFRKISYGIWETHLQDFGFCVTHTNAIQQQNTLDKLD